MAKRDLIVCEICGQWGADPLSGTHLTTRECVRALRHRADALEMKIIAARAVDGRHAREASRA